MTDNFYIVSTPIGNKEDISIRALAVLFSSDILFCEDTRRTASFLGYYRECILSGSLKIPGLDISKRTKFVSYYDEVEIEKIPEVIAEISSGKVVSLVSDSGTPLVSDPGYKIVKACIEHGIKVIPVPGPSSVLAALVASGMPSDRFSYYGYFPPKQGKVRETLDSLKKNSSGGTKTHIFFESPHRLLKTLRIINDELGDVRVCIARELTKIHEEIWTGTVSRALEHFSKPEGEFVLIIYL